MLDIEKHFKIYKVKRTAEMLLKYLERQPDKECKEWVFSFAQIRAKVCNRNIKYMIDELKECIEEDD